MFVSVYSFLLLLPLLEVWSSLKDLEQKLFKWLPYSGAETLWWGQGLGLPVKAVHHLSGDWMLPKLLQMSKRGLWIPEVCTSVITPSLVCLNVCLNFYQINIPNAQFGSCYRLLRTTEFPVGFKTKIQPAWIKNPKLSNYWPHFCLCGLITRSPPLLPLPNAPSSKPNQNPCCPPSICCTLPPAWAGHPSPHCTLESPFELSNPVLVLILSRFHVALSTERVFCSSEAQHLT